MLSSPGALCLKLVKCSPASVTPPPLQGLTVQATELSSRGARPGSEGTPLPQGSVGQASGKAQRLRGMEHLHGLQRGHLVSMGCCFQWHNVFNRKQFCVKQHRTVMVAVSSTHVSIIHVQKARGHDIIAHMFSQQL